MIGWIKFHRAFVNWEWYNDLPVRVLFIHLLLTVNYEDKKWKGRKVLKGSRITGRKQLSQESGLSEQETRTAIKKLISTNDLTTENNPLGTMFTVVNWNKYQDINQQINQEATSEQPASNQRATTTKEVNNIINKEIKEDVVVVETDIYNFEVLDVNEFKDVRELQKYYLNNLRLMNAFCNVAENNLTFEELPKRLERFTKELECEGRFKETFTEYSSYFKNWNRKVPKKQKANIDEKGRLVANMPIL